MLKRYRLHISMETLILLNLNNNIHVVNAKQETISIFNFSMFRKLYKLAMYLFCDDAVVIFSRHFETDG